MNPERWRRIEELFAAAIEREPESREAFLAERCGDDGELRDEVRNLLQSDGQGQKLEESVRGDIVGLAAAATDGVAQPLGAIGPYRVLREIGRGGMGAVYLAERAGEFEQEVAIKLIHPGMATRQTLQRFRNERQILAGLRHPNIARLLDGGSTADGRPYFVMEYIEGQPLDQYCKHRNLGTGARLEMFRSVCSAVHYAHQNLIVHRDLKPANILATEEGTPKLLDFGIARLMEAGAAAPTATVERMLTPGYASPEQLRGGLITTASDVYSLGVVLYELLTGRSPYRVSRESPLEMAKEVCEVEPEAPSTVTRRQQYKENEVSRRLRGDLDNIVLLALQKDPRRRYASVEHLSEDIRRYLEGEPVLARKPTHGYRAWKFVKRNRVATVAASLVAALLAAFTIDTQILARRAERERVKAESVSSFLIDLFRIAEPSEAHGNAVTAREMLDRGAARIEAELSGQPEVQASLMSVMGDACLGLGLFKQSVPMFEKAVESRRLLYGSGSVEVARGRSELCSGLIYRGDYAAAERTCLEALEVQRRKLGPRHPDIAGTLTSLGNIYSIQGNPGKAEPVWKEALDIRRTEPSVKPEVLATAINNLGLARYTLGDLIGAESLYGEALTMRRRARGDLDGLVATIMGNLGVLQWRLGDLRGAENMLRQQLAIKKKLYGAEHTDIPLTLSNLAMALVDKGEAGEAVATAREAVDMFDRIRGANYPGAAFARTAMGLALDLRGMNPEPNAGCAMHSIFAPKRWETKAPPWWRAWRRWGGFSRTRATMRKRRGSCGSHSIRRLSRYRAGSLETMTALYGLGRLLRLSGRNEEAAKPLGEALELIRQHYPPQSWKVGMAEIEYGACLRNMGRGEEGQALLRHAYQNLRVALGDNHRRTRQALQLVQGGR